MAALIIETQEHTGSLDGLVYKFTRAKNSYTLIVKDGFYEVWTDSVYGLSVKIFNSVSLLNEETGKPMPKFMKDVITLVKAS